MRTMDPTKLNELERRVEVQGAQLAGLAQMLCITLDCMILGEIPEGTRKDLLVRDYDKLREGIAKYDKAYRDMLDYLHLRAFPKEGEAA